MSLGTWNALRVACKQLKLSQNMVENAKKFALLER